MITSLARLALLATLLAATPAFADVAAGQSGPLTVKPDATVDRDQILVGDLFDNAGAAATQPVGTAPAPGGKNMYDVSALARVARAYGLDWQPNRLDVRVNVTRATTTVTTLQIGEAVREGIGALTKSPATPTATVASMKYDVQLDRRAMEINLPASNIVQSVKVVDLNYDPKSYRFNGTLMVELGDGAQPSMTTLTGRAVPQVDVPVIAHHVDAGTALADSDLQYVTMAADRIPVDLVRDPAQLIGKECRRALEAGNQIAERDLRPAQLVKRGTLVTMVIDSGAMHITARARALADGAKGETVKVMNLQSNKVIEGTVGPTGNVMVTSQG